MGCVLLLQLIVVNTDREDNRNPSSNFGKQGTDLAAPGEAMPQQSGAIIADNQWSSLKKHL